jgi:uncharacterized protein (TIGR03083 family)
METDPRIWIAALRRSHDELVVFVDTLDGEALRRASACSEWSVAQVLAHLGSGAELSLESIEAAVAGRELRGPETFPAVWDRWNSMSPQEVVAAFRVADERHVAAVEALDDDALGNVRMKFVFLPEPVDVATAVGLRLSEHTQHSWDVFVSFRPDATLAPSGTELLIDRVGVLLPFLAKPEALGPREGSIALDVVTERPSRRFTLDIGDSVSLAEGDAANADGMLAMPAEALLRLSFGRLDESHTPDSVTVSGPLSLDDLRRMFPGV